VLCAVRYRSLRRADHSSGVPSSVVRWSECNREATTMRRPWPTRECCATGGKKYVQTLGTREDASKKIITMNNEVPAVYMQYASYRVFSLEDVGNPLQEYPKPEPGTLGI
jgi:hypothetical protein